MIVNCDAKSLEVNVAGYLSQDSILLKEVASGFDMHTANQIYLKLPGWEDAEQHIPSERAKLGRLIAKIFVFRLIYGGTAYAYSVDNDFSSCHFNVHQWQKIIDTFYDKYKGLQEWHTSIVAEVVRTGFLKMPTGREYHYKPTRDYRGELKWPRTQILNYPVQGLGADIMAIARVSFAKKFMDSKIRGVLINTVHDSIEVDVESMDDVKLATRLFFETFENIPKDFEAIFGVKYNLPMFCEVSYGQNRKDLKEILLTDC